jgi:hypothetical protein
VTRKGPGLLPSPSTEPEYVEVMKFRLRELESAGCDKDAARRIAERLDIDLHTACRIRAQGCSVMTALEILL